MKSHTESKLKSYTESTWEEFEKYVESDITKFPYEQDDKNYQKKESAFKWHKVVCKRMQGFGHKIIEHHSGEYDFFSTGFLFFAEDGVHFETISFEPDKDVKDSDKDRGVIYTYEDIGIINNDEAKLEFSKDVKRQQEAARKAIEKYKQKQLDIKLKQEEKQKAEQEKQKAKDKQEIEKAERVHEICDKIAVNPFVRHKKWGIGKVIEINNSKGEITVKFENSGETIEIDIMTAFVENKLMEFVEV